MDANVQTKNPRRIARNTLMLYVRMLFLLFVGLYTSRVVLLALGVDDFGVYNVVGGFVAMFSVLSGALSGAISRFLTFELGKGDSEKLGAVFSSSVTIQTAMALLVILLAEGLGLWFIGSGMQIAPERIGAAKIVLQLSILTFAINLISVPYNAAIIAHERMKAFAVIGIGEGLGKLGVAVAIAHFGGDRLILYAVLMCIVALLVRLCYGLFCHRNFEECRAKFRWDGALTRRMFAFAGWHFLGSGAGVLRDHGGNILINLFSGTAVNAARGVALQLSGAVQNFATNFMTAINPQITKSYAAGDLEYTRKLVFKGARYSFFLLLLLGLPVLANLPFLMEVWLKEVPALAVEFAALALLLAMSESLSGTLITALLATGEIRNYQLIVGGITLINIPLSWLLLKLGFAPTCVMVVAIALSQVCLFARVLLLSGKAGFKAVKFITGVWARSLGTAAVAAALPFLLAPLLHDGWAGCLESIAVCLAWTLLAVAFLGLDKDERKTFLKTKKHDI